jgi:hypothetical protein
MNQRCVVPAHTGTSLGGATKWIPACAGMTQKRSAQLRFGVAVQRRLTSISCVVPAEAGTPWGVATKWIPACAGMTPGSGVMSTIGVVPAQAGTTRAAT